jgi:hypothetical protein
MKTHKCEKCGGWVNCADEPLFVGGQNLEDPKSDFYGGSYRACECPVVGKEYPVTLVGGDGKTPAGPGGEVIIETNNKIERLDVVSDAKIIKTEEDPNIVFDLNDTNYKGIMRISKGKFYWKGQEIDDVQDIYEKVCAFFHVADPMDI